MKTREKKTLHCQDNTLLLYIKMNAIGEIRYVSDISFVLPRLFFFITDCILRNEQCSIISHGHHDHFQTTQRYLPHVFFIFENADSFLRFRTNTCPHVAYSNRFRPKTMFKAMSTNFINYLARKKERNREQNNYLFQEKVGQLKIHLSNRKIPHKKQKT